MARQETSMKRFLPSLALATLLSLSVGAVRAQDQVVYHVNDTQSQALAALRNVRNHLDTDPTARITVVAMPLAWTS
jgi:hypothetical protein